MAVMVVVMMIVAVVVVVMMIVAVMVVVMMIVGVMVVVMMIVAVVIVVMPQCLSVVQRDTTPTITAARCSRVHLIRGHSRQHSKDSARHVHVRLSHALATIASHLSLALGRRIESLFLSDGGRVFALLHRLLSEVRARSLF